MTVEYCPICRRAKDEPPGGECVVTEWHVWADVPATGRRRVEVTVVVIEDDGRSEVKWTFGNVPNKPLVNLEPNEPLLTLDPFRIPRPVERYDFQFSLTARPDETGKAALIEWHR